jgi:multimeric flavodoxin WrbA
MMNAYIEKMMSAQGILIGSPTYFGDITPELRAFIDRTGMVCRTNGDLLARKVGAAVISVRRGGAVHAFMSANNMFFLNQMVIPCSRYWNFAFGPQKGKVLEDEEGMDTMRTLGRNMAWTIKKLHG